ncbi:phosphoenolpyruvate--protein phosphotransferase [Blautia sp. 2744]|uniref:Phosphoenolpyruvate-protein phosphotransferase n=2 Tax=Blautia TaxID=572511 RepID=D4LSD6_9FIRM|nr:MULTISPECIES: phosphoenolpyruvate--protein phosphotransferase [Blautia]MBC5740041.1 phosphoenolpyruvate--protein phosphotransferase [Blautia intestinalis]RHA46495.1 phosphoenolpyruvate--protein phosphotransferase [Blautia obeum]RHD30801.1 phosphoenolpyruvate--protein phosphotransferase [Blautia obeum]CBL23694.1 phosphoenolpyruvate-protein phosphotransferase [Blautia obeum A2-162]
MEIYKGIATFSGIAIGKVLYYSRGEYQIRLCLVSNIKKEISNFQEARLQAVQKLHELYEASRLINEQESRVFLRQIKLLESESYQNAIESSIASEKVNAAYAVMINRDELVETFRNLEEPVIRRRINDMQEISNRLIQILGGAAIRINLGDEPVILVAEALSPTEIMEMDKDKLLAVVMHHGSTVSHASIMAKTMEIPTLVDIAADDEWDGMTAIVDGYTGTFYLNPDAEIRREYEIRLEADRREREALLELKAQKDETKDGRKIGLYANIGNMSDLSSVLYYGAKGIGLLRSEFQYLGRENYPRENELFRAYKKVAETMGERLAVIRTADLGADKQAPYLDIPQETNPIMGNRGIRLCLDRRRMFKAQLRAIYRASAYGNLAMMFPMIDSEEEMNEIEEIIEEVKAGLREKDIPFKDIMTGIMIETPAAVMISRELARRVDFLSIGTNDLTQYTLAMDRQNPLLKDKYNDHHPAVLRMVRMVVDAAHKEQRRVGICGELAADTALTGKFLEMGVDFLSVVPACVLPVRKAIRETDLSGVSAPAVNEDNNE